MTKKQEALVGELISLLPEGQRLSFAEIANYLAELGYMPQRQKVADFVLSFKHQENGKVIAKIGVRKQKGFISIKFFGCKDAPERYKDALREEIDARRQQYCGPLRDQNQKNRCGFCPACTGGGVGYYYRYPDGKELLRCGAYPIEIPDFGEGDVAGMKQILSEQHRYFLSIG